MHAHVKSFGATCKLTIIECVHAVLNPQKLQQSHHGVKLPLLPSYTVTIHPLEEQEMVNLVAVEETAAKMKYLHLK